MSQQDKRHKMFHGDTFYLAVPPAVLLGLFSVVVGLGLIVVDNITSRYGMYTWFMTLSSHPNDSGYQSGANLFSIALGIVCTLLEMFMVFQMGNHYVTRLAAQQNTGTQGADHSEHNVPDKWHISFFIVNELQNWFPMVVAGLSIITTAFGLYQWEGPTTAMALWAIATDTALGLIVLFGGCYLFIKGWHPLEHALREYRQNKRTVYVSPNFRGDITNITTSRPAQDLRGMDPSVNNSRSLPSPRSQGNSAPPEMEDLRDRIPSKQRH